MVAFCLFTDFASFADIAHLVSDHLLQSRAQRARTVFDSFLQLINGRRLSSAHVNHGIVTEEIIKVIEAVAVWEPVDLGFAADDAVPKHCVEELHDFRHNVVWLVAPSQ